MADKEQTKRPKKDYLTLAGYAYYTFVHSPQKDEKYGDKYKVDLVVEDEEGNPFIYTNPLNGKQVNMVQLCEDENIKVEQSKGIPGRFIRVKSKFEYTIKNPKTGKKEIKERDPIPTAYADKSPVDSNTLIGNGSKVRVLASVKKWVNDEDENVTTLYLERMIVDELVPYVNSQSEKEFDFPHMKVNKKAEGKTDEEVPFEE